MPRQSRNTQQNRPPKFVASAAGDSDLSIHVQDNGTTRHLSAASLSRSFELPREEHRRLFIIIAIAACLCLSLLVAYNVRVMMQVHESQALVSEAISRGVSLDLPNLENYVGKTNKAMIQQFEDDGYRTYDNSNEEDTSVNGFDIFKIADDVTDEDAAAAYSQGIENLDDEDIARYLAGSWRFLMSRADGAEIRLRYADFDAQSPEQAIQTAANAESFVELVESEITQDSAGNTTFSGTFKKSNKTWRYTISACDLSQVYDIDGAPGGAQFVVIRITEDAS